MADDRAYRVLIQYIPEASSFVAQSPELDLKAEASSRAEAIDSLEKEIEATIQKAANNEEKLRPPIDVASESGEVTLRLSAPLWRDLQVHAEAQKLNPEELAIQILSRGLGHMDGRRRRPARENQPTPPTPETDTNERSPTESTPKQERKEGARQNNRRGRRRREGYRPDIEDQANFLAYVRDQERGGRGRR
ncbi:MAG: hypothetical protein KTR25_21080 [Myxococcales bacterium]|nr:hypothetical protein [Myxococcales bacterium]